MPNARLALLAAILGCAAGVAHATQYSIVTVDAPDPTTLQTVVSGINESGQTSGYYITAPTPMTGGLPGYTGFLGNAAGTVFTPVTYPGAIATGLSAINNAGTTVGVAIDFTFTGRGFSRAADGTYTTIDAASLGAVYSEAVGINNTGSIVGYYTTVVPPSIDMIQLYAHGFLLDSTGYHTLDVPAAFGTGTELFNINDAGQITGTYLDAFGLPHGILYTPGTGFALSEPPGALASSADGLNNQGVIVGGTFAPDPLNPAGFDSTGYILQAGVYTPFVVPGALSTEPETINDLGQIVGTYTDAAGVHGFIATPVPEPRSLALLGTGLAAAGMLRRRRRAS